MGGSLHQREGGGSDVAMTTVNEILNDDAVLPDRLAFRLIRTRLSALFLFFVCDNITSCGASLPRFFKPLSTPSVFHYDNYTPDAN